MLLGAKVARAHGVPFDPFSTVGKGGGRWLIWPHPSGRRLWTDAAIRRARQQIAELLAEPTPATPGGTP